MPAARCPSIGAISFPIAGPREWSPAEPSRDDSYASFSSSQVCEHPVQPPTVGVPNRQHVFRVVVLSDELYGLPSQRM
jgi:hypothetical protein